MNPAAVFTIRNTCAFCGTPLAPGQTADPSTPSQESHYCCYGCRLLGQAGQRPSDSGRHEVSTWFKIAVSGAIAGQAMLLDLAINMDPPEGVGRGLLHLVLMLSAAGVCALLGMPLLRSIKEAFLNREITVDLLFLCGIAGALAASVQATMRGQGATYYEVVAILLVVYAAGKTLCAESRARALAEAGELRHAFETCARLENDGRAQRVPVSQIVAGDTIVVRQGESIAVDGIIQSGQGFVCQTPLTGEPMPVVCRPGDTVLAGSVSEDGELIVRAVCSGTKRRLDGILAEVEEARQRPGAWQLQADRVVRWFLPLLLVVSIATGLAWWARDGVAAAWSHAMAVLLVACPCALGLATPLAIWSALAVLATRGFVARHGDVIEGLATLKHVAFDKTGTLSEPRAVLVDLVAEGDACQRQILLSLLQAVQRQSPHPIARAFDAIVSPAEAAVVSGVKTVPGKGLQAWVRLSGQEYYLCAGQRELYNEHAREPELLDRLRPRLEDSLIYVWLDGQLHAVGSVRERLRPSVSQTFASLAQLGVSSSVLTGDRTEHARQLGLDRTEGSLSAAAKAEKIHALAGRGPVAFVGDGINDAPALRAAHVGIALEHGAALTTANADALLYGGRLEHIPQAIAICRKVRSTLRSNLIFAAAYNAIGIGLAAAGFLDPVVCALLMMTSSAIVSWRAMRAASQAAGCCGLDVTQGAEQKTPPMAPVPWTAVSELSSAQQVVTKRGWLPVSYGILVGLQGPFLLFTGGFTQAWGAVTVLVFALGGLSLSFWRGRSAEARRFAGMTMAMLALGNWGMLVGWWADSGFSALSLGCCSQSSAWLSWMNLGMLALGLWPMVRHGHPSFSLSLRILVATLSAAGMLAGMQAGSRIASAIEITPVPAVLLGFSGMTLGMLAGMLFVCELGQAVVLRWARRHAI